MMIFCSGDDNKLIDEIFRSVPKSGNVKEEQVYVAGKQYLLKYNDRRFDFGT